MKALNFPKSHRLLRPADYGKVFDDVQLKVPHKNFLILATPNNLGHARVGLVFAKRNLNFAVQRNRIQNSRVCGKLSDTSLNFLEWTLSFLVAKGSQLWITRQFARL